LWLDPVTTTSRTAWRLQSLDSCQHHLHTQYLRQHLKKAVQRYVFNVNDLIWGDFNCSAAMQVRNPQASASLVRQFVDESNTGRQDDPLACWKGRVQVYRKLVPLAQKSICIVATSVPSEWVFSKTGQLISVRRNRLAGSTVTVLRVVIVYFV